MFRIYYSSSEVDGETREDWIAAPDEDVQVIRTYGPHPTNIQEARERHGYVFCRSKWPLYTGVDKYDTLGFGVKHGSLLSDAAYQAVWDRAYGDD